MKQRREEGMGDERRIWLEGGRKWGDGSRFLRTVCFLKKLKVP